ncbi:hypothetical protein LINGRAHAP2_LOCUS19411, partial [Linum grandiflorum]
MMKFVSVNLHKAILEFQITTCIRFFFQDSTFLVLQVNFVPDCSSITYLPSLSFLVSHFFFKK